MLKEVAKHVEPKDIYEVYEKYRLGKKLEKEAEQEELLKKAFKQAEGDGSYIKYEVQVPIPENKKYNEEESLTAWSKYLKQREVLEDKNRVRREKPKSYEEKFDKVEDSGLKDIKDYIKSEEH